LLSKTASKAVDLAHNQHVKLTGVRHLAHSIEFFQVEGSAFCAPLILYQFGNDRVPL